MKTILFKILISFGVLISNQAYAAQECNILVSRTFAGEGTFWVTTAQGSSAYFRTSLPDAKIMIASILANKVQDRPIVLRFSGEVSCSSFNSRGDVIGIWAL